MANPIAAIADLGLNELATLEAQTVRMTCELVNKENAYNTANPENTSDRFTITPNYDTNEVVIEITLSLADDACISPVYEKVNAAV